MTETRSHQAGLRCTWASIAKTYNQPTQDLKLSNPALAEREIRPGDQVMILDPQWLARLRVLRGFQGNIAAIDQDIMALQQRGAQDFVARSALPELLATRNRRVGELSKVLGTEFLQVAEGKGYDESQLVPTLHRLGTDLKALGFGDRESAELVDAASERIRNDLDRMFGPFRTSIAAAQADPSQWAAVDAELTRHFERFTRSGGGMEVLRQVGETLKKFGPNDPEWRGRIDSASKPERVR